MIQDYLGQDINVGDVMVYGSGRGGLEHGLVLSITEDTNLGYHNWRTGKIQVARLDRNMKWVWDNDNRQGEYVDYGGFRVKKVTHTNACHSVVLKEEQYMNSDKASTLYHFKDEILAGAKKVGVNNG